MMEEHRGPEQGSGAEQRLHPAVGTGGKGEHLVVPCVLCCSHVCRIRILLSNTYEAHKLVSCTWAELEVLVDRSHLTTRQKQQHSGASH